MRLPQKPEEVFNFVRRAQEIQVQLGFAMESDDRNTVFWIERRGGRAWQAVTTLGDKTLETVQLQTCSPAVVTHLPSGDAD